MKLRITVKLCLLFLLILSFGYLAINCSSPGDNKQQGTPDSNKASDFLLKDIDGKEVKLSDFKGKVVLLNFWATWCIPCKAEIPGIINLQTKYANQGFTVIGVSVDEDGAKSVKPFYTENKMNYPVVLFDDKTINDYGGIHGYPTTFLIDQGQQIVKKYFGPQDEKVFEADIQNVLNKTQGTH